MNSNDTFTPISQEGIRAITPYKSLFQDSHDALYTFNGDSTLDPYTYHPGVDEFITQLYAHHFIQAFDWQSWESEASSYSTHLEQIGEANWPEIIKLFTFHIRKERFENGHLPPLLDSGFFASMIQRVDELGPTKQ